MKIKHWQGYGTVNAVKEGRLVHDGWVILNIKVTGDHEWGLVRDDEYDLINWLVKRFDKSFKGNHVLYGYESGVKDGVEYCRYQFEYKEEC